jgi:hypothetical protein
MASGTVGSDYLMNARQFMEAALQLLDDSNAPAQIGAHLDLALCQLREHLNGADTDQDISLRPNLAS